MTCQGRELLCVLCDEEVDDFDLHKHSDAHMARFTVCQTLAAPQKHDAMLKQMWDHLRLDFDAVAEVNAEKVERRRSRLASTVTYLVQRSVLLHSIPRPEDQVEPAGTSQDGSSNSSGKAGPGTGSPLVVSKDFEKMEFLGELDLRRVVTDRCARLFPHATGAQLRALVDFITARWQLEVAHDLLGLGQAVAEGLRQQRDPAARAPRGALGHRPTGIGASEAEAKADAPLASALKLSGAQRARVLLAVIGELHLRTDAVVKPITVAGGKAAADGLVDNVLAAHASENIESELIYHVLQKIVDEGTPVWNEFKESLAAMSLARTRPAPPSLSASPTPRADGPGIADVVAPSAAIAVEEAANGTLRPACAPKLDWTELGRAGALDLTVPNSKHKAAFFAPLAPKLANKAKGVKS